MRKMKQSDANHHNIQSHTILGSKSQRGLTQMSLDVIFKALEPTIKPPDNSINPNLLASVAASDPCEAQFFAAQTFLEAVYGDPNADRGRNSRAQTPISSSRGNTPLVVRNPLPSKLMQKISVFGRLYPSLPSVPTSPSGSVADLLRAQTVEIRTMCLKIPLYDWFLDPHQRHIYTQG